LQREEVVGLESDRGMSQAPDGIHHEGGARDKHQRERHLRDHQNGSRLAGVSGRSPAALLEGHLQVRLGGLPGREHAEQERRDERGNQCVPEHPAVQCPGGRREQFLASDRWEQFERGTRDE